jgi:hypothetical protein
MLHVAGIICLACYDGVWAALLSYAFHIFDILPFVIEAVFVFSIYWDFLVWGLLYSTSLLCSVPRCVIRCMYFIKGCYLV